MAVTFVATAHVLSTGDSSIDVEIQVSELSDEKAVSTTTSFETMVPSTPEDQYRLRRKIAAVISDMLVSDELTSSSASTPQVVYRDAKSGNFVTREYAEAHPDTTVKETNK